MVIVAQLVRALDCGSRGRRFEPGLSPKIKPLISRGFFVLTIFFGIENVGKLREVVFFKYTNSCYLD